MELSQPTLPTLKKARKRKNQYHMKSLGCTPLKYNRPNFNGTSKGTG